MLGRESYALRRYQVTVRIVQSGQMRVDRLHDLIGRVWACNRQHLRMRIFHDTTLGAQAAGYDNLTILG